MNHLITTLRRKADCNVQNGRELSSWLASVQSMKFPGLAFVHAKSVIGLVALLLLVRIVYLRHFSALSGIPGPIFGSVSRAWLAYQSHRGKMHRVMQKLHQEHGNLVRTGPDEVSISDLSAIKQMYGPGSKFKKSDWYSVWQGNQKWDLFAERNIDIHAGLRRNISRMYAMSSMTALEGWMDDAIACFLKRMRDQEGKAADLALTCAADVIGEVSFSKRFGYLEAGRDDGTLGRIETALRSLCWVGQLPWIFWLDHYLGPYIGHHLGLVLRHGTIRNYAAKEVEHRKGRIAEHGDILGQLFEVQKAKPGQLPDSAIISVATANVFAGSDTTAITLRAIIYNLLTHPECLEKMLQEVGERKAAGVLTFPIKFSQAASMPYLQACISETLRIHPAVGMALPRVVPSGGMTVGSTFLPAGTIVGANAWVVHRDPTVWGDHVDEFRPERWFEGNKSDMERYLLAFGGGARSCIGKNISIMEISKLIPTLFHDFHLELTYPENALSEDCRWFVKQEGLIVNLQAKTEKLH